MCQSACFKLGYKDAESFWIKESFFKNILYIYLYNLKYSNIYKSLIISVLQNKHF